MSWVLIECQLKDEERGDIIGFYNKVFVQKMKDYLLATKSVTMEQGARTPVLNRSNFEALLTPGGRPQKPGMIKEMCPMIPLVDQIDKRKTIFTPLLH
jgi:hypothetical protein